MSFKTFLSENMDEISIDNIKSHSIDWNSYIKEYDSFDKGLIKAWGEVLYLDIHKLPDTISKIVSHDEYEEYFKDFNNAEYGDDEYDDMVDHLSDLPPTINGGIALFDKNRIYNSLDKISKKTRLKDEIIVYRMTDKKDDGHEEWKSYTAGDPKKYGSKVDNTIAYKLSSGYPVIFAHGLADNDELIININPHDKRVKEIKIK
jgi:hypothetical protein